MIKIVATGGTVQNTPAGRIPLEDVLQRLQTEYLDSDRIQLPPYEIREVIRTGSETFTPTEWLQIAQAVREATLEDDASGVVVTHGTFSAEETAFFLHLTVQTRLPIVMVCSQRRHGTIGNDGDHNLLSALRTASTSDAVGKGVLLVISQEIHSAREVTKVNQRPGGFSSGPLGLLGSVETDQVTFYRAPTRRHTNHSEFDIAQLSSLPRVDIAASYPGDDGTAIRAFIDAGSEGLIISGFAFSGEPHRDALPAAAKAVSLGIPVVFASRGNQGRVPHEDDEFIQADSLPAQKARVLLAIALTRTQQSSELQRVFDQY